MLRKTSAVFIASLAAVMLLTGCVLPTPDKGAQAEQKTLDSLTQLTDGVYFMDCYTDYMVDDYLKANISDIEHFDKWMTENLTHGVPTGDIPEMACSSFAVSAPDGDHLFGRNYELTGGHSMIIRTAPENGYASLCIADLRQINLGKNGDYKLDDEKGRSLLFAAPWAIADGVNEKGLGVSLLELNDKHIVTDTDKDDLLIYAATRVILDKCASVDEAIRFFEDHDVYSGRPNTYHFFITDASGRSAVVEWVDGEMQVVEDNAVTNFTLYGREITDSTDLRYFKLRKGLDETDSMTSGDAMALLEAVTSTAPTAGPPFTIWRDSALRSASMRIFPIHTHIPEERNREETRLTL